MAALLTTLYDRLDVREIAALREATRLAEQSAMHLYVVGGTVRDLLLGCESLDLDFVVEGDAVAFAEALGLRMGARVLRHRRFGTATITDPGFRLDLASARSEAYSEPGELPIVAPANLASDLARRDFTINAIAMSLTGPRPGRLIDPHRGKADLAEKVIRVLHPLSFQDDPTRMFRAARYAARYNFRLERRTRSLLRRDRGYLNSVSGVRLRHELERIAAERRPSQALRLASDVGLLSAGEHASCVSEGQWKALRRLEEAEVCVRNEDVAMTILLGGQDEDKVEAAISSLSLTRRQSNAVRALRDLLDQEEDLRPADLLPSVLVTHVAQHPLAAIEALSLITDCVRVQERLRAYVDVWRHVRPRLTGSDLQALGLRAGPDLGVALTELRNARLDGSVSTREDEVSYIAARLSDDEG